MAITTTVPRAAVPAGQGGHFSTLSCQPRSPPAPRNLKRAPISASLLNLQGTTQTFASVCVQSPMLCIPLLEQRPSPRDHVPGHPPHTARLSQQLHWRRQAIHVKVLPGLLDACTLGERAARFALPLLLLRLLVSVLLFVCCDFVMVSDRKYRQIG